MKSSIVSGESRGSVPNILLKALQSGDKYGYEINKEIETKSKGRYFLKEASLYSGLKRLESAGFITSYWKDGELGMRRHYYSITPAGLEKLNKSNFTWDDSKTFMIEIFNDYKKKSSSQNFENHNQNTTNGENHNPSLLEQFKQAEKLEQTNKIEEKTETSEVQTKPEVKKNPFQIEVSPLQQSIFDLGFTTPKNEEILNKISEENEENNKEIKIEQVLEKKEENPLNNTIEDENKQINLIEEKSEIEIQNIGKNQQVTINEIIENKQKEDTLSTKSYENNSITYEQMLANYSLDNYSQTINEVREKIDISKYLSKEKENDSNIIMSKNENDNKVDFPFQNLEKQENLEKPVQQNIQQNNIENRETKNILNQIEEKIETEQKEQADYKNIFGNLLVDDKSKVDKEINEIEIPVEEEIVEKDEKPTLPRINVDNDINIMFNSNQVKPKTNFQPITQEIPIRSGTNTVPNVKQYINNVHKKTLISRATNIEEEVNLDGINIRQYQKMNNKPIKNSNYVYINKLNFFLVILFASIILTESIISFIVFNSNKLLGAFEIILLSVLIIVSLISIYLTSLSYFKDKYKVELKNYNFKRSIFYLTLIFLVVSIIFVCINIFQGMNASNSTYFVLRILLETLISSNLVLMPLVKLWFYKLKVFSN